MQDYIPDTEIIKKLKAANTTERNQVMTYLYKRMYASVKKLILSNSGQEDEVEDLFQEALIGFYKLVVQDKIASDTKVEAYIYSICRNLWMKQLNKKKKRKQIQNHLSKENVVVAPVKSFLLREQQAVLNQLLEHLGKDCKQILHSYYYERKKMKEIAEIMSFSNEQVAKNKKSKCMKKLRDLISAKKLKKDFFY